MSEENILNLQCLVGNYLNGFKIVSIQKDPFIKGQINLFTDIAKDIGFGDKQVVKFYIRNVSSSAIIYEEQVNINKYILTEFEKWLETTLTIEKTQQTSEMYIKGFQECLDKLQELKEGTINHE